MKRKNNPRVITETIIRDAIDIIDGVKNSDEVERFMNRNRGRSFRSIAQASSKLTLVFPVIMSTSLSIETAAMITKAIERKCVVMLQILFSACSISNAKDGVEYIQQFHNNLRASNDVTVDSLIDALDKYVANTESMTYDDKAAYQQISEEVKYHLDHILEDSISESGLESYMFRKDPSGETVLMQEAGPFSVNIPDYGDIGGIRPDFDKMRYNAVGNKHSLNIYRSIDDDDDENYTNIPRVSGLGPDINDQPEISSSNSISGKGSSGGSTSGTISSTGDDTTKRTDRKSTVNQRTVTRFRMNNPSSGSLPSRKMSAKDIADTKKNQAEFFNKQLISSDVKKCNELVPTMMVVNFVVPGEKDPIYTSMLIGVKAKMYPVDSMDIINRLTLKYNDKNNLLKFIKATTAEISFCRDFLFAIDKAKLDALSQSKRGSSSVLWKVLERRALKSKFRRGTSTVNDATAITTLVVSSEEVEYMLKYSNIDISNPRVMRKLLEAYNFMGAVIANESTEVASFIFDSGDDIYEDISYRSLERESGGQSEKKIINMLARQQSR